MTTEQKLEKAIQALEWYAKYDSWKKSYKDAHTKIMDVDHEYNIELTKDLGYGVTEEVLGTCGGKLARQILKEIR